MTRRRWTACALLAGLVAATVSTYPLVTHLRDSVAAPQPHAHKDPDYRLVMWILDEGGRRLYTDPLHFYEANIFYPFRHSLAYSETMLSAGALVAPLNRLTGNPIVGYNLYFLATIVLSLLGTFLLVREISGDARAGLIAGWLFALSADRLWAGGHLPTLSVHWVPFVFYTWVRFLAAPGWGRALWLAAALAAHMHSGAYHGLMLPVLLVPWAVVMIITGPWPFRRWLASGAVLVPALIASLALYLPYLAVQEELQRQPFGMFGLWGKWYWGAFADPFGYLAGLVSGSRAITYTSPLPIVLLALAGTSLMGRAHAREPRGERAHLVALIAFALAAMAVSLGPWLATDLRGPFYYLHQLPGFGGMRVPRRFLLLATFGSSAMAGLAVAVLMRRIRSSTVSTVFLLGLAAVILVDSRTLHIPTTLKRFPTPAEVPPVYRWLATAPPDTAVLELPYGPWPYESLYVYYSLYHRRRLVNGYSGTMPRVTEALVGFPDALSIRTLQDAGVRYVIAHRDLMLALPRGNERLARIQARSDLAQRWIGSAIVTEVPRGTPRPAPTPPRRELDRRYWQLKGSAPEAQLAADGDLDTHWKAMILDQDSFLRIDLRSEAEVTGVTIRMGTHAVEYPRRYTLWASPDGAAWQQAGGAPATLPPFASYRRNHLDVEVPLEMHPVRARYLEIRVPKRRGFMQPAAWGVHELRIYGATARSD